MLRIAERGEWVYDGSVTMPVDIVALDYDFWFEVAKADGEIELGELPIELAEPGVLYYVRFRRAGDESEPTWVDSGAHHTVADAKVFAQSKVETRIRWLAT